LTAQLREGLSQGDVVDVCPVGSIPPIRVARLWKDEEPPEQRATLFTHAPGTAYKRPPAPALFKKEPELVLLEGVLRRCVVLSEDCVVLEKVKNKLNTSGQVSRKTRDLPWHVAPLEPWPPDTDTIQIDGKQMPKGPFIEAGRFKSLLAVPTLAGPDGRPLVEKGFVDLRYVTPLRADFTIMRLASMTDGGRAVLAAKLYTFWSGLHVPESLACPSCGARHSLESFLKAQAENATGS